MGSVNKVILVGNLGRDAELRYTPGGAAVSKFSLATTEVWTDKQGQRQERTEWHNIDLWGKQAESLNEYLRKGKQVYMRGAAADRGVDRQRRREAEDAPKSAAIASSCSAVEAVAAAARQRIAASRWAAELRTPSRHQSR